MKNILILVFTFFIFSFAMAADHSDVRIYTNPNVNIDYSHVVSTPKVNNYSNYSVVNAATMSSVQNYTRMMNKIFQPLPKPNGVFNQPKIASQSGYPGLSQQMVMSSQMQKFNQAHKVNSLGSRLESQAAVSNMNNINVRQALTSEFGQPKPVDTQEIIKDKD